jgi:hypothetical protein
MEKNKKTTFHPTLENLGYINDSLREYAEQVATRYGSKHDIATPELTTYHDPSGSRLRYYVVEPDAQFATAFSQEHQDLLVMPHPFAHGFRNAKEMVLSAQTVANYLQLPIVGFPNNSGAESNEYLSPRTRDRAKQIGIQAIAEMRSGAVEQVAKKYAPDGLVHFNSWSEGGTAAVAQALAASEVMPIGSVGSYDAPTVVDRKMLQIAYDFIRSDKGESRIDIIRRSGLGALEELGTHRARYFLGILGVSVYEDKYIDASLMTFRTNFLRAASFGRACLRDSLDTILAAHDYAVADIAVTEKSLISPPGANQDIASSLKATYPGRVNFTLLDGSGHAEGNNPFDIAVLANRSVRQAQAQYYDHTRPVAA